MRACACEFEEEAEEAGDKEFLQHCQRLGKILGMTESLSCLLECHQKKLFSGETGGS
jgi:hypothetical protein